MVAPIGNTHAPRIVVEAQSHAEGNYQRELVACGKKKCGKCGGSRAAHGPYWYLYQWQPAGPDRTLQRKGKLRCVYIGKTFERRIG